ncbi:hypothetical protein VpasPP24_24 [Vibrio phage Vpas_PP24]|nr:hypothetical protein VpasPP24_24 [Vibrio phage Vpas_PP24]
MSNTEKKTVAKKQANRPNIKEHASKIMLSVLHTIDATQSALRVIPVERDGSLMDYTNQIRNKAEHINKASTGNMPHDHLAFHCLDMCGVIMELHEHYGQLSYATDKDNIKPYIYKSVSALIDALVVQTDDLSRIAENKLKDFIAGCTDGR